MTRSSGSKVKAVRRGGEAADRPSACVVDIFCGAGGLSHGFRQRGFEIVGGVDIDEDCRYAFESNNGAPFIRRDVAVLTGHEVDALFTPGRARAYMLQHLLRNRLFSTVLRPAWLSRCPDLTVVRKTIEQMREEFVRDEEATTRLG